MESILRSQKKKKIGANLVRSCCNVVMEVELWWVETSNWSQRRAVKSTSVVFNGEVRHWCFFCKGANWQIKEPINPNIFTSKEMEK